LKRKIDLKAGCGKDVICFSEKGDTFVMDKGKGFLPKDSDNKNNVVEEITIWERIVIGKGSGVLTFEEDRSEQDILEEVYLLGVEELNDWEIPTIKIKNATRASAIG
jgi:hypothetical protein